MRTVARVGGLDMYVVTYSDVCSVAHGVQPTNK